ncbi:MAG: MlaD family protein [Verrucomicrobiota bacterium]
MTIFRNEIRTGLLVTITLTALVGVLIYLGAPGVFVAQKSFRIYFDNAAGLEPGAPVLLAGRKIGQITLLHSPVPEKERPKPELEAMIEVQVEKSSRIFTKVQARMTLPSMLGKPVIDFTSGQEASGLAPEGTAFIGERQPGLADAVPTILKKLDPTLAKVTETLGSLQKTSDNLSKLTEKDADIAKALAEYRKFGVHLNELSGPDSSLRRSLANIEKMTGEEGKLSDALDNIGTLTGPDSDLAKAMANAEKFTDGLANNKDINATMRNMREATENLDTQISRLGGKFSSIAGNLDQASHTVKHQPWRLIWPTTKKYPGESGTSSSSAPLVLKKSGTSPATAATTSPAPPARKPWFKRSSSSP